MLDEFQRFKKFIQSLESNFKALKVIFKILKLSLSIAVFKALKTVFQKL